MATPTSSNQLAPTPRGAPPPSQALLLRVRTGRHAGRLLRLPPGDCLVGASPECAVQLRAPGVRPRHCAIRPGDRWLVVRSLAPQTWLNGRPFTSARLAPGDVLAVGPVEFDVVPAQASSPSPAAPPAPPKPDRLAAPNRPRPADSNGHTAEGELLRELEAARAALERQRGELERERAALHEARARLAQWEAALAEQEAAAAARRREQQERRDQWERQRAAWERQAAETEALQHQLQEERAALDRARAALDAERAALAQQPAGGSVASDRESERLKSLAAELVETKRRHESEKQQWAADREWLENELRAQRQRTREQQEELERLQQELLEAKTAASPGRPDPAAPSEAEAVQEPPQEQARSGLSAAELLARAGYRPDWEREGPDESDRADAGPVEQPGCVPDPGRPQPSCPPETRPEAGEGPQAVAFDPAAGEPDEDDQEADYEVASYVQRLLQRLQGEREQAERAVGGERRSPSPIAPSPTPAPPRDQHEPAPPKRPAPRQGPPPERSRDMGALRELANTSARHAIQTSLRKRFGSAMASRALIALVAAAVGIATLWMGGDRLPPAAAYGGKTALVVAVWYLFETARSARSLRLHARRTAP